MKRIVVYKRFHRPEWRNGLTRLLNQLVKLFAFVLGEDSVCRGAHGSFSDFAFCSSLVEVRAQDHLFTLFNHGMFNYLTHPCTKRNGRLSILNGERNASIKFEQEFMGRGPMDVKAFVYPPRHRSRSLSDMRDRHEIVLV